MKTSQLIELLEISIAKYGDREVQLYDGDYRSIVCVAYPEDDDDKSAIVICDAETLEVLS